MRWWAGADKPTTPAAQFDEDVAAGLRAMGVSQQDIDAEQERRQELLEVQADFELHEDNWAVWQFFMGLQTQWDCVCLGNSIWRIGLPTNRIESEARMMGWPRSRWPALLGDVRVMEFELLAADAELAAGEKQYQ